MLLGLLTITALQLLCYIQATYAEDIFNHFVMYLYDWVILGRNNALNSKLRLSLFLFSLPEMYHSHREQDELNRIE